MCRRIFGSLILILLMCRRFVVFWIGFMVLRFFWCFGVRLVLGCWWVVCSLW